MEGKKDTEADGTANKQSPGPSTPVPAASRPEVDDFGLPIRPHLTPRETATSEKSGVGHSDAVPEAGAASDLKDRGKDDLVVSDNSISNNAGATAIKSSELAASERREPTESTAERHDGDSDSDDAAFEDAPSAPPGPSTESSNAPETNIDTSTPQTPTPQTPTQAPKASNEAHTSAQTPSGSEAKTTSTAKADVPETDSKDSKDSQAAEATPRAKDDVVAPAVDDDNKKVAADTPTSPSNQQGEKPKGGHNRDISVASIVSASGTAGVSEFSHQQLSTAQDEEAVEKDEGWQTMPAFAPYDIYDDDNRLVAREHNEEEEEEEKYAYGGLGGAGKGYTRVQMDEDAESATSMDENTQYLFKEANGTSMTDEEGRDAVAQMQATKDLLTEGQRIAYVGIVRLEIAKLVKEAEQLEITRKIKKEVNMAAEAVKMWGQKMMIRLYTHMDISEAEQVMIEQLAEHGVMPRDLTPALHANSRVQNPMAEDVKSNGNSNRGSTSSLPRPSEDAPDYDDELPAEMPPPYESVDPSEMPDVKTPSQLPTTEKIDIDLRWTVLCDLFLILIADSVYDARSRVILERVAEDLEISWIDICRFEKRVTDALEMQQAAEKENWNEDEHMESRRKMALKKRYMMMGLATVGGGLVIGLSAGLLAPVIGAGLAAGFTTIGVTGTSSFLAGAGGAAVITSSAAASGSFIGVRAANRRTGAVRTFEYRPLHNNKRVNLVVTVSGWLTGKVDDVRLPFSTVDPIMGDIYSVLWEPEMLRSTGDTINILATEALTQGLQQLLGSTILVSLMAALQLPLVLTKLSYLIDNPWAVSLDRAMSAGLILADSLMDRSLGTRPITLVGYSLGSRVIFSCLQELAKRGAYGLVQNVYIFGSPVVVKSDQFTRARTVVSGRFVNGYNKNDWILGYLFRLTNGGIRRVAGLAPIENPWVENIDVTEEVQGHMQYRTAMPKLLIKCGWVVESEEFSEIEDPDPENHEGRQRELINEIEEARKELEKEGKAKKSGGFSLFGRRKKAERQEWEVYEDTAGKENAGAGGSGKTEDKEGNNHGVLFDIDAIRAELAREAKYGNDAEIPEMALQIKEIKSTLPPMKLDISPTTPSSQQLSPSPSGDARGSLRETKSADVLPSHGMALGAGVGAASSISANGSLGLPSHYDDPVEEEISMTFDTSFDEPSHAQQTRSSYSHEEGSAGTTGDERPTMRTSQTLPNMTLADPWNDPDDDDFGEEKEISMTFA